MWIESNLCLNESKMDTCVGMYEYLQRRIHVGRGISNGQSIMTVHISEAERMESKSNLLLTNFVEDPDASISDRDYGNENPAKYRSSLKRFTQGLVRRSHNCGESANTDSYIVSNTFLSELFRRKKINDLR